jgi:hypothetical protein
VLRRLLALVLVALAAGACQVRTEVGIDVEEDGSGRVTVSVGLDADALERVPQLADQLRTSDLAAAGWDITGPEAGDGGFTWFRAEKGFETPDEATELLEDLAGEDGPLRDLSLRRTRSFARTSFEFRGTVDFSGGLEAFGDDELAASLDGEPLGEDVAAIEERLGQTLDNVFRFQLAVRLPGDVSSNAPSTISNGAVWQPRLSEGAPVMLLASSTEWRTTTLLWLGGAAVALLALVAVLVRRLIRRRGTTFDG